MRSGSRENVIKTRLITIGVLALTILLLGLLEDHPHIIENYYSEGIYLLICRVMHPVFNLFPFSVGDVLYLVLIGYFIYSLIQFIRLLIKKRFNHAAILVLGTVITIQVLMLAFYLLWGINYFRPPAAERLNLPDSSYTTTQLAAVTSILIDSANATRARVTANDLKQSDKTICQVAIQAVRSLSASSVSFITYSPDIKLSLFTPLLNYIGTSGYYNPYTTEAQMNYQMPIFLQPFVACHEMSHQIGYGAEDEANFVGFLAGIRSNNRLLRYSAYHEAVDEFMRDLWQRDTVLHKKLKSHVSPAVHNDFKTERDYWLSYENKANIITGIFYDKFLKANNQPHGLLTYNRMIRLIMAWHRREVISSLVH